VLVTNFFEGFVNSLNYLDELRNHIFKQAINDSYLGAFVISRKSTINFVMSARLFVRVEQLGSHWKDFYEI